MASKDFEPDQAAHGVANDADGGVGVLGLSLEGDLLDAVDQRFDANPSVDEAEIGDDDFCLGAGDLGGELANA